VYMRVSSYSKVDAVEQRYMVKSGARGKKDRNPRSEIGVDWYSTLIRVECQLSIIAHSSTKYR
jgi:hypothetical protein